MADGGFCRGTAASTRCVPQIGGQLHAWEPLGAVSRALPRRTARGERHCWHSAGTHTPPRPCAYIGTRAAASSWPCGARRAARVSVLYAALKQCLYVTRQKLISDASWDNDLNAPVSETLSGYLDGAVTLSKRYTLVGDTQVPFDVSHVWPAGVRPRGRLCPSSEDSGDGGAFIHAPVRSSSQDFPAGLLPRGRFFTIAWAPAPLASTLQISVVAECP